MYMKKYEDFKAIALGEHKKAKEEKMRCKAGGLKRCCRSIGYKRTKPLLAAKRVQKG